MRNWILVLAVACSHVSAGMLPDKAREELIALVLKNFWGKAKLSTGQFAQPSSEEERTTIPISKAVAYRALDAGEISGLGEWCKLDWESNFLSLTKAARSRGLNDKQVAFASVLHGTAQGRVASAMTRSGACNDQDRARAERLLNQSRVRGLEGLNEP